MVPIVQSLQSFQECDAANIFRFRIPLLIRFGSSARSMAVPATIPHHQQAYDLVVSGKIQTAFNIDEESAETRTAYGTESIAQKLLLAGRLVESGITFVVVSGAWGSFNQHGDDAHWVNNRDRAVPFVPERGRPIPESG